jgi:hypothetical protein
MGFSPSDVGRMSLWEFGAAVAGWNEAHGGEADSAKLTDDDVVRLSALIDGATDGG